MNLGGPLHLVSDEAWWKFVKPTGQIEMKWMKMNLWKDIEIRKLN